MHRMIPLTLALAAACASVPAEAPAEDAAALAAALGDRKQAGEPLDCVSHRDLQASRPIGESYILYESWGDTIYVNRPEAGCPGLHPSRALIVRTPTNRLCRGDIVEVRDLTSGMTYGSCALGAFTRYERR